MRQHLVLLWGLLLLPALTEAARAQRAPARLPPVDTTAVVTLRLADGSDLTGRVVQRDDSSLVVATPAGLVVTVPYRAVAGWQSRRGRLVGGQFRESDPNTTRLFFAPTGRTLPAGRSYFADYFLFFPFVATGATDWLTVAAGMSILPGASSQLVYLAPKLGVARGPRLNASIGGIYATVPGEEGSVGAGYGALTVGDEDAAVTVVAGYAFTNGERSEEPGFVFGGEQRLGAGTKGLIEAWKLPGVTEVPVIFGLRLFSRTITVDFGLFRVLGTDTSGFPFIPWVDFVVSF